MMMKKTIWIVFVLLIVAGALFFGLRKPALPDAATLFPEDTMFYAGTKSPVKIAAALAFADLNGVLQKEAGLSEEESRIVSGWLRDLRGVHVGFHSFTLVPFVVDAAVVLEGSFDRPLTELLGRGLLQRIVVDEPYREIALSKMRIPLGQKFSFEIYIADPVENYIFIAFSRRTMKDLVDQMLDGGPSLVDNPQFSEMASLKGIRSADTLQYVDVQAYLNLIRDWTKTIPYPPVQPLVDLVWSELRLADYQQSVAGFHFESQEGHSFQRINPENPIYQQLLDGSPFNLPHVPVDSTQFSFYRIADPVEAMRQVVELTIRLEQGISRVIGGAPTQSVRTLLEKISAVSEQHPAEFGELLTGEIGVWQRTSPGAQNPAMCLYLGIRDPDAVKAKIATLSGVEIIETDGICQLAADASIVWSIQPDAIRISNDRNYLQASLSADEPSLDDSAEFSKLLNRLPDEFSILQYVDYKEGIPVQNASKLPPRFLSLLDLFKGFRQLSVSVAADGMLQTHTAQDYNPDRQLLKSAVEMLFSSTWKAPGQASPAEEPFLLSADEALKQSIDLLSAGRQIEAEELVEKAVRKHVDDVQLLFAKAVLERSRWDKRAAHYYFQKIGAGFPDTLAAQVAELTMQLDSKNPPTDGLEKLIELSDANPDNIYLLWLSAMQSREQARKDAISSKSKVTVAELGRTQYEKLLEKFTVGPVLLHQTYANILEDYLEEYETALKHRYIAVSMEAKEWSLEGLAYTLTRLERYPEACAIWARAVQVDPENSDLWGNWGWTLRMMDRYEEALEKHTEAYRLDPDSSYDLYNASWCLEKLGRREEMIDLNRRAANQGYADAQFKLGYLFHQGIGVEQDFEKAAKWYRLAADQGHLMAIENLGLLYSQGKGVEFNPEEAISCYENVLKVEPDHAHVMNNYAWLLLNCKDESFRDYSKALELAKRSVAMDEQLYSLNTLVVAYDRNSMYDGALQTQKRQIALRQKKSPDNPVPERLFERLERFEKEVQKQNNTVGLQ